MPRLARIVFAGVPHHITQRGNRREDVFFVEEDYHTYLDWLSHYSQQHQLEILAYRDIWGQAFGVRVEWHLLKPIRVASVGNVGGREAAVEPTRTYSRRFP